MRGHAIARERMMIARAQGFVAAPNVDVVKGVRTERAVRTYVRRSCYLIDCLVVVLLSVGRSCSIDRQRLDVAGVPPQHWRTGAMGGQAPSCRARVHGRPRSLPGDLLAPALHRRHVRLQVNIARPVSE